MTLGRAEAGLHSDYRGRRADSPPSRPEPELDLLLQLHDLLTERRLRHVEALGGTTEV